MKLKFKMKTTVIHQLAYYRLPVLILISMLAACMPAKIKHQPAQPAAATAVPENDQVRAAAPAGSPPVATTANAKLSGESQHSEHNDSTLAGYDLKLETDLYLGSGEFINREAAAHPLQQAVEEGEIILNFEAAEIQEVVKVILSDMLQQNYAIAPGVKGKVTFSTAKPVANAQLVPILETILSWNNAAMIFRDGRFQILPLAEAIPGNLTPGIGPVPVQAGYKVQVVPLNYIAPSQMEKLLKPFAHKDAIVSADDQRRLLILSGTSQELRNYMQTIQTFDVDWLAGMSVGFFSLQHVDTETVVKEIKVLLGAEEKDGSPVADLIRFMEIERLNAIVAITPQPEYLNRVNAWIDRLDRVGDRGAGIRLYVYNVANVDAAGLADTLNDIFSNNGSGDRSKQSRQRGNSGNVAPGLEPVEITSINDPRRKQQQQEQEKDNREQTVPEEVVDGLAVFNSDDIRITAIEENNALLIRSTSAQYQTLIGAIELLDVPPLQVMIEARVIEVSLSGSLSYGVEWYLKNAAADQFPGVTGGNIFRSGRVGSAGFSYSFANIDVGVIVSALQSAGDTQLLSAPTLMVLNNEQATINVGTQIPVNTTNINTGDASAITTNVQFRDTGVTLGVTPRINPGGLVFLDISQSVSAPLPGVDSNGNVSVSQRTLNTKIAVQSGDSVIMGGLISNQETRNKDGVPYLSQIPVLGALFGRKSDDNTQTELVVLLSPKVIRDQQESRNVSLEYQKKFQYIMPIEIRE